MCCCSRVGTECGTFLFARAMRLRCAFESARPFGQPMSNSCRPDAETRVPRPNERLKRLVSRRVCWGAESTRWGPSRALGGIIDRNSAGRDSEFQIPDKFLRLSNLSPVRTPGDALFRSGNHESDCYLNQLIFSYNFASLSLARVSAEPGALCPKAEPR